MVGVFVPFHRSLASQQLYFLNPVSTIRLMRVVRLVDFLDHSGVYARAGQRSSPVLPFDSKGKAKLKKERKEKRRRSALHE